MINRLTVCLLCLLLATATSEFVGSGQLTQRLANDSDDMEGVVGAREAEALVDQDLHHYQEKQTSAEKAASLAQQDSMRSFKLYDEAQKAAAEQEAEARHLKTKLAIILEQDANDSKVATKAEAIAKRMAALAAKAEAQLHDVQQKEKETRDRLQTVKDQAELSEANEKMQHQKQEEAEAQAKAASAKLAKLDLKITKLLDRRSRLKDIAAAEDKRASTSLAEAFKEDANRQAKFKEALAKEREIEHEHRKQMALLRLESKVRLQSAKPATDSSHKAISQDPSGSAAHLTGNVRTPDGAAQDMRRSDASASEPLAVQGNGVALSPYQEANDGETGELQGNSEQKNTESSSERYAGGQDADSADIETRDMEGFDQARRQRSQLALSREGQASDQGELGRRLERLLKSERSEGWRVGGWRLSGGRSGGNQQQRVESRPGGEGMVPEQEDFAKAFDAQQSSGDASGYDFVIHASAARRSAGDDAK